MKNRRSWKPKTKEDRLLQTYWKKNGGMIYTEVPIGGLEEEGNGKAGVPEGDWLRFDLSHGKEIFGNTRNQMMTL